MSYALPDVAKTAERLQAEIEQAVRQWPRFHKFSHGARLRDQIALVVQLANRAWRDQPNRMEWTERLVFAVDDLKSALQVGKQIQAFKSFEQFEMLARQTDYRADHRPLSILYEVSP